MRINKYIARCGVTSRRKAEGLIESGEVSLNGKPVKDLNTTVEVDKDIVLVGGTEITLPKPAYYAMNKPTGYTTTKYDEHAEKKVMDLLPNDASLFPVGRLDKDTSGLLIVTNDGEFAQNIIHPSKKIEKEYEVTTEEGVTKEHLSKLVGTITLSDGPAKMNSIKKVADNTLLITIEEGRNRIVRRIFSEVGNEVKKLKRTRVGVIGLDVPSGKYRALTKEEIQEYA